MNLKIAGVGGQEIPSIGQTSLGQVSLGQAPAAKSDGVDFAHELGRAIGEAGANERAADDAAKRFAAGDPQIGLHEVMIASEKASIAVRYATTLQKKLIDAYREIMNTSI